MGSYGEFQDGADNDAQYGALYEPEIAFYKDCVRARGGRALVQSRLLCVSWWDVARLPVPCPK